MLFPNTVQPEENPSANPVHDRHGGLREEICQRVAEEGILEPEEILKQLDGRMTLSELLAIGRETAEIELFETPKTQVWLWRGQ